MPVRTFHLMTESQFIEQNREKWAELEKLLNQPNKDADKLQELFIKVSSDLSYARTFYPKRSVRLYLNNLTQKVFDSMGKKKSGFKFSSIVEFFQHSLPQEAYRQRKVILLSFIIFAFSMFIGAISTMNNPDFAKVVLGEYYVSMTDANINEGDPMKVYKDSAQMGMFQRITINNIRVAFFCFILGLMGGVGTSFILISNGIMVGVFQYYFYSKGLFLTSFLTIWIHGTLEISSIVIAGAAGLVLGNGILFPKTYKRTTALQIAAKRSLVLIFGTVPLFVAAGLLEAFVTRHTGLPTFAKVAIIGISLLIILTMFVIYPYFYNKYVSPVDPNPQVHVQHDEEFTYERYMLRTLSENLSLSFAQFRMFFGVNLKKVIFPCLTFAAFLFYFIVYNLKETNAFGLLNFTNGGFIVPIVMAIMAALIICYMELFLKNNLEHVDGILPFMKKYFLYVFIISLLIVLAFFQFGGWTLVGLIFIPPQVITALFDIKFGDSPYDTNNFSKNINIAYSRYAHFIIPALISGFFFLVFIRFFFSAFAYIIYEIANWHKIFEGAYATNQYIYSLIMLLIGFSLLPLVYFMYNNFYYSGKCAKESVDLQSRLPSFGQDQKMFE